jgi:hypothetical protein
MPTTRTTSRLRWLLPFGVVLSACQGTPPEAAEQAPSAALPDACEKAEAMWNDKILPSRYEQLPPLAGVGFVDLLAVLNRAFSLKAFTTEGDELETGRRKRIHAFGAEARLRLEILPSAQSRFTGFFQSGAECAIGRFSLASKPSERGSIPALAIKLFVDGKHSSLNLHLMNSVDVQDGHDFFATDFSNVLPPARSFATQMLDRAFRAVAEDFGAKDPNPGRLTLDHLSGMLPSGAAVSAPATPYQLILKPTTVARSLMPGATAGDDFRIRLAALPVGTAIYEIHALDAGESAEVSRPLGKLVLTSPIVSSRYGDEVLYFQHHTERK